MSALHRRTRHRDSEDAEGAGAKVYISCRCTAGDEGRLALYRVFGG